MNIFIYRTIISVILFSLVIVSCKKETEEDEAAPVQVLSSTITTNISFNATMETGSTYIIDGTIYVDGATLTIEPGVTVKFAKKSSLVFGVHQDGARLIANGTSSKPIVFTSNEYYPAEGDWNNIKFTSGAVNSSLKHCKILYGGGLSGDNGIIDINDCAVAIENCTIEYSENRGIDLDDDGSFSRFTGNIIRNCENEAICLYVNSVHTIGANNKISDSPILVKGGDFRQEFSKKWRYQEVPFIIEGTVNVYSSPGSKLTIDAGNTIKFKEGGVFSIGTDGVSGTLVAKGTADSIITFTSAETYRNEGDWSGLLFDKGASNGCVVNNCIVEYGGDNDSRYSNIVFDKTHGNVTISNSHISYAKGYGMYIDSLSNPILVNNTFSYNNYGEQYQE